MEQRSVVTWAGWPGQIAHAFRLRPQDGGRAMSLCATRWQSAPMSTGRRCTDCLRVLAIEARDARRMAEEGARG